MSRSRRVAHTENSQKHLHSIIAFIQRTKMRHTLHRKSMYSIRLAVIFWKTHSKDTMRAFLRMDRQVNL